MSGLCVLSMFWTQVQGKQLGVAGSIFNIQSVRSRQAGRGNVLKLTVNFTPEIITLSKEVIKSLFIKYVWDVLL